MHAILRAVRVFAGLLAIGGAATAVTPPGPNAPPAPGASPPPAVAALLARAKPPPTVAPPCKPGACPFAGQTVNVIVTADQISASLYELKHEYEAATGATLRISAVPFDEHFANFVADASHGSGRYDASIAGAWWLGELVEGGYLLPYDRYYRDPRFPAWNIDDVLPGPRGLLSYAGRRYMVANDHDGQVMYYRRDLLADPQHRAAFQRRYGYALDVPQTWEQFRDIAEYFHGRDLIGDGVAGSGVVMHLKVGAQGMFHFMSFSAPFVIGPANPRLYWFDPATMKPLIGSPGHVKALETLVELTRFGPREMLGWDLRQSWDHFLAGRAALAFSWGDLGALAQEEGSKVRGRVGTAPMPGTRRYYAVAQQRWIDTERPNVVGNVTGGSWAGVISRSSKAPAATYYLLALMAAQPKSRVYAARGWDGVDPGRFSHFPPPHGKASIDDYVRAGWDADDVQHYLRAYHANFDNRQQLPYLRIPGTFSYWQALDLHLAAAASGQLSAQAALQAAAVDFEEITLRLGRERQKRIYRSSLGL